MKAFLIVLFISSISLYNSVEPNKKCNEIINPKGKEDCYNSTIREGYYACCYEFYAVKSATYPSCVEITQANYTNLEEFKKQRRPQIYTNYTFECQISGSNYLALSLLSLIFLLL